VTDAEGFSLRDHRVVVTGASMGIGLGIAERFVDAGADVLIAARRPEPLEQAAVALRERATAQQQVHAVQADTSDPTSIDALFRSVDERFDRVDTFVANAGTGFVKPFLDLTLDDWNGIVALNLTGTFIGCQHAARRMVASPAPNRSILVVGSVRSLGTRFGLVPYSTTKAGLNQMVRCMAYELAEHGVRVNGVLPGVTVTPLAAQNPEIVAERVKTIPLGRAGLPTDMAGAALYLASPAAQFVTGVNLVVDGGESLF
jgi:NAD(P)-dependent dehydrogenase (short-subunit alcohol dehydrogenase family)